MSSLQTYSSMKRKRIAEAKKATTIASTAAKTAIITASPTRPSTSSSYSSPTRVVAAPAGSVGSDVNHALRYQHYDKLDSEQQAAIDKFIEQKLWLSPRHIKKLESWAERAWEARASQKMRILFLKNLDDSIEILCCCASSEAKKRAKTWPRAGRAVVTAGYSNPKWHSRTGQEGHRRGRAHISGDD